MDTTIQFTQEGFDKIKLELNELVQNKRPQAVTRLGVARSMGDLKENSEYQAAKEDLAFIEGRIQELEEVVKRASIVETHSTNIVQIGSKVTVSIDDTTDVFEIVGDFEADPMNHKLSQTSPLGKALLSKKIGDQVEIEVPAGKKTYKIVDIA